MFLYYNVFLRGAISTVKDIKISNTHLEYPYLKNKFLLEIPTYYYYANNDILLYYLYYLRPDRSWPLP